MSRHELAFGPFVLDVESHRLTRDGAVIPLKPMAFDLLTLFVQNGGRLISKEELFRALWAGVAVEESSLTQNVYELRRALGDSDREHRYIETVPRRGYRFVAPVSSSPAADGRLAIAVLPLRTLSPSPEHHYLGEGIAEAIIGTLASVDGFAVRSLSSARRVSTLDAFEAGAQLSVAVVLEGTVQTEGDSARVSVRLLEVASRSVLWAATYDQTLDSVFTVQDSTARKIAAALARRGPVTRNHPDERSVRAHHLYLRGRYNWNKATPEGLWKAIDFFRATLREDPAHALSWVGISDSYTALDWYGALSTAESNGEAEAAARKALEIDADLAEAHAALAMARQYAWDWDGAEAEYRKAISLDPRYAPAEQWYGVFLAFMGRFTESLEHLRRAQDLDPVSISVNAQVGLVLLCARAYADAEDQVLQVLETEPGSVEARFYLGMLHELLGRFEEAVEVYASLPQDNGDFRAMLAHALAGAGREDDARRIMQELTARTGYVAPFWLAVAWVGLQQRERALAALERACDAPDDSLLGVKVLPFLEPLHDEPRFISVLERMRLRS